MSSSDLCERLGYRFNQTELLRQALTHRSYGTPHNERLEFLGDSVLDCVVARMIFEAFPQLPEGNLSRLRANLVNQDMLFRVAQSIELGEEILLGEGEIKSGGSRRPSILADALEALFGAIFLDAGFETAERVVSGLFSPLVHELDPKTLGKDPKTLLQEWVQGRRLPLPQYAVVATTGGAHEQQFQVECVIPELHIRTLGVGSSRRGAEQEAARQAYEMATSGPNAVKGGRGNKGPKT